MYNKQYSYKYKAVIRMLCVCVCVCVYVCVFILQPYTRTLVTMLKFYSLILTFSLPSLMNSMV